MSVVAQDKYEGVGGSYVIDPETGLRTLIERTQPADETPVMETEENGTTEA